MGRADGGRDARLPVPGAEPARDFRIRRADDGDDPSTVRFALEIDSLLLRLLVPGMELVYDRATRRLLRYDGISNLLDGNGENERVVVEFEYGDRHSARSKRHAGAPAAQQAR